jgi:hypothetical protein
MVIPPQEIVRRYGCSPTTLDYITLGSPWTSRRDRPEQRTILQNFRKDRYQLLRSMTAAASRSRTQLCVTWRGDRAFCPDDAWAQAKIDEWLFWEQYSHEPYIAVCRFQMLYQGKPKQAREAWRVERGERAIDLMENQLVDREWLATGAFTIADIALVAYSRLAHEGGFDLSGRPGVTAWISRCENALGIRRASAVCS